MLITHFTSGRMISLKVGLTRVCIVHELHIKKHRDRIHQGYVLLKSFITGITGQQVRVGFRDLGDQISTPTAIRKLLDD